jgi:hypothetical protein
LYCHKLQSIKGVASTRDGRHPYWPQIIALARAAGSRPSRRLLHRADPEGREVADLPIEQASKFALVINQKTARALRLTVPARLLAIADELVE